MISALDAPKRAELGEAAEAAHLRARRDVVIVIKAKKAAVDEDAANLEGVGGTNCSTQKATSHKDRPQNQKQFAAEVAELTGESKQNINRKIARAEAIGLARQTSRMPR